MKSLYLSIKFFVLFLSISFANNTLADDFRTKGHYVGLDAIISYVKFNPRFTTTSNPVHTNYATFSDHSVGAGLNYKYALNFNNFFISPGFILEFNNARASGTDNGMSSRSSNQNYLYRVDIQNRFGLQVDTGYDIHRYFSPYVSLGYSRIVYKTRGRLTSGGNSLGSEVGGSALYDWSYGLGFKSNITNRLSFDLGYNRNSFLAKVRLPEGYGVTTRYKVGLDTYKMGLSYKF